MIKSNLLIVAAAFAVFPSLVFPGYVPDLKPAPQPIHSAPTPSHTDKHVTQEQKYSDPSPKPPKDDLSAHNEKYYLPSNSKPSNLNDPLPKEETPAKKYSNDPEHKPDVKHDEPAKVAPTPSDPKYGSPKHEKPAKHEPKPTDPKYGAHKPEHPGKNDPKPTEPKYGSPKHEELVKSDPKTSNHDAALPKHDQHRPTEPNYGSPAPNQPEKQEAPKEEKPGKSYAKPITAVYA
ncbi:hypothetical protein O181_082129 [Austropuccinia psidii MF-1]|uniref:Early nodulin-75-like n=1 Tax=Austropuccinia psidii MF-1 TaxID=1389203 RepID=A0A9Q3FNN2_9BASI|nr:hypothetical protein [Austropuccinia psidii MF-1]